MLRTHMLEHADRHDPVELLVEQPVIPKLELHMIGDPGSGGSRSCNLELPFGEGHPQNVDSGDLVHEERHAAPAATDVEDALAGLECELRRDVGFLVELRLL